MRKYVVGLTCLIFLGLYNYSIFDKQTHLATGMTVNLALAPVDPRSLMQGDYMALDYAIARQIRTAVYKQSAQGESIDDSLQQPLLPTVDYVVVAITEGQVAEFVRIDDGSPLAQAEAKLQFRVRKNRIKFATNAYFFEEGTAAAYENAKFGQFKVNAKGEVLLHALLDDQLEPI